MKLSTLDALCCPRSHGGQPCGGELAVGDAIDPTFAPGDPAELIEGVIGCDACGARYPVLAGVLVLLDEIAGYFKARYPYVVSTAAGAGLSAPMLAVLGRLGLDRYGPVNDQPFERPQPVELALCSHYDDEAGLGGRDHPLAGLLGEVRHRGFWPTIEESVGNEPAAEALEIGCGVGGMVGRLARGGRRVFGTDLSFAAVLAARRVLLGHPAPLDHYNLAGDGLLYERRPLPSVTVDGEVDLFVSSGLDRPFRRAFPLVAMLNLVDIVPAPTQLLERAAAAVIPGGRLLVASPYAWILGLAPPERWIGGAGETASPEGMRAWFAEHDFDVDWEQDAIPWGMRIYGRCHQVFLVHAVVGRRR